MAESKATLANWRAAPHNRWAFHHVREIVPSADIPSDPCGIRTPRLSSQALPVDVARIGLSLRAVSQIRRLLAQR
jgi:hypothetical protein